MAYKSPLQIAKDLGVQIKLLHYDAEFMQNEELLNIRPSMQMYGPFLRGHESSILSEKWQKSGIPIKGNNYWTLGPATELGSSSRFDPSSNLYQAWFGIYTHTGINGMRFGMKGKEPDMELLGRLAEADQQFWLKAYGDDNPVAKLNTFLHVGKLKVDGNDAWLYYGEIESHSDVGFNGKGYEGVYGIVRQRRFSSEENIDARLFIPNPALWNAYVDQHHKINLKGFFTVIPFPTAMACIYINGAEYIDNNRKHYDTWRVLRNDAINLIRSVKIEQLARKENID